MAYAVGYAPIKKNPRIRVRINAPPGASITSATYDDHPTILYTTERTAEGATISFIANWPLSEPTETSWDVAVNWRLLGTVTTLEKGQQAATTRQAKFACNKIHVYQDGDGLRLLVLTEIKEIEEPVPRPLTRVKPPAGRAVSPVASPPVQKANAKAKAAEAAEKRAARAEVIANQAAEDGVTELPDEPDLP